MADHSKEIANILKIKLGETIDNSTVDELVDYIKSCEDCKVDIDTIQQTIKLVRTGDFEYLLPQSVSERLLKVLDLE